MAGLNELHRVIVLEKSSNSSIFFSRLEDLFRGLKSCLLSHQLNSNTSDSAQQSGIQSNNNQVADNIVEILLKANQILFEMMPDISASDELEIQMAQLIPIFIENLGSPKAVVRKSTHKCIGTYVKLTRKLEFVILHIIQTGLENQNSRTRQHSMLVIPALLSLKSSIMDKEVVEMKDLLQAVIKRIKTDQSEIVSKTGKKLILELQKCYPNSFQSLYIEKIKNKEEKFICQAVIKNDEGMLRQVLAGTLPELKVLQQKPQAHELSIIGREIMQSMSKPETLEKPVKESKYPRAQNGLLFAFLNDETVETLCSETVQWQIRANSIESIENELKSVLNSSSQKVDFLPYTTPFLGFIIGFIQDINFKISLTAIQITNKLLVLKMINIKKYYVQLVNTLVQKLSDSKVIIRQAVLKCCGKIIESNKPVMFTQYAMKYLQHTNWHVREGILHLIANCFIVQSTQDELTRDEIQIDDHLSISVSLISELCMAAKIESKSKIQQMTIDCLALCLEVSQNKSKTEQMILRELGLSMDSKKNLTKDQQLFNLIIERQNPEYLPAMQIDGSIEFKPAIVVAEQQPVEVPEEPPQPKKSIAPVQEAIVQDIESKVIHEPLKTKDQQPPQIQKQQSAVVKEEQKKDDSKLQMRFQQERIQKNQSQGSQQQQKQSSPYDVVLSQSNRQQFSLSTIANDGKLTINTQVAKINDGPVKSALLNRKESLGSGLQPQKSEDIIEPVNKTTRDENKIQMWLPSYSENQQSQQAQQASAEKDPVTPYYKEKKYSTNLKPRGSLQNSNAYSHATPGPSKSQLPSLTSQVSESEAKSTQLSSKIQPNSRRIQEITSNQMRSPISQTESKPSVQQNSFQISQKHAITQGYTPEQHISKPRVIQSNEIRQRTLNDASLSQASGSPKSRLVAGNKNEFISIQQSPLIGSSNIGVNESQSSHTDQIKQYPSIHNTDMKVLQQRNMSQSSGAPGGFGVNKSQINERLQLLKSTFKFKNSNSSEHQEIRSDIEEAKSFDNSIRYKGDQQKANSEYNMRGLNKINNNNYMLNTGSHLGNPQQTHNSFGFSNNSGVKQQSTTGYTTGATRVQNKSFQNAKSFQTKSYNPGSTAGPVKATAAIPQSNFLTTIQMEEKVPSQQRTRKPPMNKVADNRSSSVINNSVEQNPSFQELPMGGSQNTTTHYNAPEEPLRNPEVQFKLAVQNLLSDDWQKVFDALNTLKRVAMFHKGLMSMSSNPEAKESIKSIVKQTDNLRSQVAKNACMTLQVVYTELPTKDLDQNVDLVMSALLKKATDTNHFVSEQAEKALIMVCSACTESKVFNSLQQVNGRSAQLKQKICLCYGNLISKLGMKIKTYKDSDRLIRAIVAMLSEGALEVRNQAKLAILTLKNNLQAGRDFDTLILKCGLTDKQVEQVRKIAETNDYESLSNFANTRYGVSMRGSSMDSRGVDPNRQTPNDNPRIHASGSDGFSQFSESKMQQTFLSGGPAGQSNYGTANGFGMTNTSIHTFKKRQTSVSKPVDPQVMESFKDLIAKCNTHDWSQRLQSINDIGQWIEKHAVTIKQTQASKFIQLLDTYCNLLQDNNAKVQAKALSSFKEFLVNENLRQLIDSNLTMIVQAMSHNFASSIDKVKDQSEQLLIILSETTDNISQLIQPIVAQVNLSNNRSKSQLIQRLACIIQRVDHPTTIERYVLPILKPEHKLQTEAKTNPKLREALKQLEQAVYQK